MAELTKELYSVTLSVLLSKDFEGALKLIDRMLQRDRCQLLPSFPKPMLIPRPTSETCSSILARLLEYGQYEKMSDLYSKMRKYGISRPPEVKKLMVSSRVERDMLGLLNSIIPKIHYKLPITRPTSDICSSILAQLLEEGQYDDMDVIFSKMKSYSVKRTSDVEKIMTSSYEQRDMLGLRYKIVPQIDHNLLGPYSRAVLV